MATAFHRGPKTAAFAVCLGICAILSATASLCQGGAVSEKERWHAALKAKSINGYAAFLKEFPDTDKKKEIRKQVDSLILGRISREMKERNARVFDKALNGTGVLPLSTDMKTGGTLIVPEEGVIGAGIQAFPDPTDPMKLRAVPDPTKAGSQLFELVGGRGAVLQEYQGRIAIYVFGVDVSPLVASWEKIAVDKFHYFRGVPAKK